MDKEVIEIDPPSPGIYAVPEHHLYSWEKEEIKEKERQQKEAQSQPQVVAGKKLTFDRNQEFGAENIDISGEALSNAFKKVKDEENQEEDKVEENLETTKKISGIPWATSRTDVEDPWVKLHNEIIEFFRTFGPNRKRNALRKELFKKIKKVIKAVFPDCIVKIFGSTAAMLYLPQSDIDIVVFLPQKSTNDLKNARKLHRMISSISWVTSCECIPAKVPLVKLTDKESRLSVDISFSRGNGVAALSFIKKYQLIYPELKYLLLIIKAFLKTRDLNETFHGGMSSFVCTLLIISYLQEIKKEKQNHSLLLSEHLLNFFHLYGVRFNYNELGISIRNGGSYFLRQSRGWLATNRSKAVTLCVENPQDTTVDLGKGVYNMTQVHAALQHAFDVLRFNTSNSESLLECIMGDLSNLK
ncbi:unnamed protein product [Moneuplotes crassus]|uniref:Uncharacterized protein n=1 Tax=Euplotes crassus TaxID=5936 RepID=A0AAD1ULS2_EUPCR|nr:unnamed protein product [Moneuplotes crassus]